MKLITCLMVLIFLLPLDGVAVEEWQQSSTASVTLAVRPRDGNAAYLVRFRVTDASGRESAASVSISRDDWGIVVFPSDFQVIGNPGDYTWSAMVDDETVGQGTFTIEPTAPGISRVFVPTGRNHR